MNFPRGTELLVIVILLILVFGWKRLPDAARSLGRSARVFKSEVDEMKKDGKPDAADETVPGQSAEIRQTPQVAPPPAQQFSGQEPPAQQPQFQQPQAAPSQQTPQPPDDPTRPVA